MLNVGGRITSSDGTHIELSTEEAVAQVRPIEVHEPGK